ncbi:uncharacterized protein LOC114272578 [Camellia sinensis]|uniref:uncharacterized protein LOC114272578 n=1 Tax=Camellia sinensis TaxID=4442 RepID=UPI001035B7AD|nr:uncharacterized protein LOC114272578 [Camellia sinensis]
MSFIWGNAIPPRVQFFGWLAWNGRIKVVDLLPKFGILNNPNLSVSHFCRSDTETVDHILLSSNRVWKAWVVCLDWWDGNRVRKKDKAIWAAIFFAVLWSTWLARNQMVFQNLQPDWDSILDLTKIRVAFCVKAKTNLMEYLLMTLSTICSKLDWAVRDSVFDLFGFWCGICSVFGVR